MKQIIEHIHCPVNGWDCPYYTDHNHPCRCTLANPMEECDDFATFWDEGDDYIDDDWVVVEEEQTAQPTLTDLLINELKEKGCEMGYNGSNWYSLATIKKIAKEIEERGNKK